MINWPKRLPTTSGKTRSDNARRERDRCYRIGVFTSIGCNRGDFWNALTSEKSGIQRIRAFDPDGHLSQIASEIIPFNPEDFISRKQARKMARVSQLASCAAIEAVKDAGLDLESENLARIGCVIGSAAGDYANIEEQHLRFQQKGPGSVNPLSIHRSIPNMPACNAAIVLGVQVIRTRFLIGEV